MTAPVAAAQKASIIAHFKAFRMSADVARGRTWAVDMKAALADPRLSRRKGTVGVTTYIKSTLMNNAPFGFTTLPRKDGAPKPKARSRDAGLCIGRVTDKRFREVVAKQRTLSRHNPRDARLVSIFALLRRLKITPIATQVAVHCARAPVHTAIDGLGMSGSDAYVLELKCTQLTLADHRRRYSVPCRNNPTLVNGMPNTEKMHHLLQAAFGVVAFRSTYTVPHGVRVHGLVVVSCVDGVAYYTAPAALAAERHFCVGGELRPNPNPKPARKKKPKKPKKALSAVPLPFVEFEPDAALMARLSRMGYAVPPCRFSPDERIAVFKRVAGSGEAAVAIVKPGARVNRPKAVHKMAWALGRDAVAKGAAVMMLARPNASQWRLEPVKLT